MAAFIQEMQLKLYNKEMTCIKNKHKMNIKTGINAIINVT